MLENITQAHEMNELKIMSFWPFGRLQNLPAIQIYKIIYINIYICIYFLVIAAMKLKDACSLEEKLWQT